MRPADVLFESEPACAVAAVCDHYAGREKFILKALDLQGQLGPVFDVTCDCEDGAPVGQEKAHAEMIVRILQSEKNRHRRAGVRIHDLTGVHWQWELEMFVRELGSVLAHIAVPKCSSADDVRKVLAALSDARRRFGVEREIPLHVLIETHGALRAVWDIAALPGVRVLDFGLMDFISAHGGAIPMSALHSPAQFEHQLIVRAKAEIAAAALAFGKVPSHNVTAELSDPRRAGEDAFRAKREFGYLRMWSIHPSQIQPIVEAMKPDFRETEFAQVLLLAAQHSNWAPVEFQGRLHDRASYRYYWQILQMAERCGSAISADARKFLFGE